MSSEFHHKQTADPNKRNKRIGLLLIITPLVGLFAVLFIYAIVSFVLTSIGTATTETTTAVAGAATSSTDLATTIGSIIKGVLGFLGVVFDVWIIIGIPLGILYLRKKVLLPNEEYDKRSGNGGATVAPSEIKRWSWGAFGLPVLWGIYHGVWISLLCFIPLINFAVMVYLGIKGNELAWQRNRWKSVENFHKSQRKWAAAGVTAFIVLIVLTPLYLLSSLANLANESPSKQSSYSNTSKTFSPRPLTADELFDDQSGISWKDYTSIAASFKTSFPATIPKRESESGTDESGYKYTTYTYSSEANGTTYYVFVNDFSNPQINENGPDFDVSAALEAKLNAMSSSSANAKLIDLQKISFLGKTAVRYQIGIGEERFDGVIFIQENRLYNIAIDYFASAIPSPSLEEFANHFEFL